MSFQESDLISRCIVYAKAFQDNIHINQHLFVFSSAKPDGASHESCVSRVVAITDAEVHAFGCDLAKKQNIDRKEPERGPKRRYYCGFRTSKYGDLRLTGDKYDIVLTLDGENGNRAHIDVALTVQSHDRNERNTIKLDAALHFAAAFGPATPFVCEEDAGDVHHPVVKNPLCLDEAGPDFELLETLRAKDLDGQQEQQPMIDAAKAELQ